RKTITLVKRSERKIGKIKFFCELNTFSENRQKVIYMTSESNCWLTFFLNSIFKLGWINKSEALRKQKESDEQHQAEKLLKLLQIHSEVDITLLDVSICAP
ncbi:hypothetical protein T01_2846, partial [Trichinella spiralis]